ncbi:SRPBCC family protein [Tsukamurella soli]|uniref:SRPBCC family protein n=1 Tax=Tsukamurella soli TaxID=644556 RepID=UPI00360E692F
MAKVRLTTILPLPPERARELAAQPETMRYVLAPYVTLAPGQELPDAVEEGLEASARMRLLGIPAWRHTIRVVRLTPDEIYTNEHGGPVRTWNHRLTFEPLPGGRCVYTDEIEVEDGPRGWPVRLFVELMFRHRHRRWRFVRAPGLAPRSEVFATPG